MEYIVNPIQTVGAKKCPHNLYSHLSNERTVKGGASTVLNFQVPI